MNLAAPFSRMAKEHGARPAVVSDELTLSYAQLRDRVRALAGALMPVARGRRVGILGSRSVEACVGVLGAAWGGFTYVPLGLSLPEERLRTVLELCDLDAVVADAAGAKLLTPRVLEKAPALVLTPDKPVTASGPEEPVARTADDLGYIEFTSGTTGVPKGVMVSCGAVAAYLDVVERMFHWTPEDRIAETCDLTFDVSVSNMFTAWGSGAALHLLKASKMMNAVKFINERGVTVWHSVPSIISLLRQVKALKPGVLPSLRLSLFIGEPLPLSAALAWKEAAPHGEVHNFYGPTEATVAVLSEPVKAEGTRTSRGRDVVSIGLPFDGVQAAVFGPDLSPVEGEASGELVLAGAQLAQGYFRSPEQTAARFVEKAGTRWYRTGDLAYRGADGAFHHLGRVDNQVKVRGHRVELEDIEAHLRAVCGTEEVAAVAWPLRDGLAEGVVGFVCRPTLAPAEILAALKKRLPDYMVPQVVYELPSLPHNANDKVDRAALVKRLATPGSGG